jgi:myo-inositol 2-dehydrogenase / D-chiro-inositol 1-dehydrogenase
MNKIVVGVIGAGRIGKVHTQSILNFIPDVKVKYVADVFQGAREWVDRLGGIAFTTDVDKIFSDPEIKAVLICSSTDTHVKYIIEAARTKKHIFCEKPVDHEIGKILEAQKAVEDNGVKFQIGFNRRFDHNFLKVKQLIDEGQVGDIYFINITSRDPDAPPISYVKASGGMFMDMTIHDFDMARFLAGSEVKEVYAKGAVFVNPEIGAAGDIDSAVIILTFENGTIATINNCRRAVYGYDQRVEVFGSKGKVEIANDTPSTAVLSSSEGIISEKPLHFFMDRYTQSYVNEIKDFLDAIINGNETPTDMVDGLKSVEIAYAAQRSLKTGLPVKI